MSSTREFNTASEEADGPSIRLRTAHFNLVTRVLGCESDIARGLLLDLHPRSVARATEDKPVGTVFIAKTLLKLAEKAAELSEYNISVGFDDLFEARPGKPSTQHAPESESEPETEFVAVAA